MQKFLSKHGISPGKATQFSHLKNIQEKIKWLGEKGVALPPGTKEAEKPKQQQQQTRRQKTDATLKKQGLNDDQIQAFHQLKGKQQRQTWLAVHNAKLPPTKKKGAARKHNGKKTAPGKAAQPKTQISNKLRKLGLKPDQINHYNSLTNPANKKAYLNSLHITLSWMRHNQQKLQCLNIMNVETYNGGLIRYIKFLFGKRRFRRRK